MMLIHNGPAHQRQCRGASAKRLDPHCDPDSENEQRRQTPWLCVILHVWLNRHSSPILFRKRTFLLFELGTPTTTIITRHWWSRVELPEIEATVKASGDETTMER